MKMVSRAVALVIAAALLSGCIGFPERIIVNRVTAEVIEEATK